jgi:hypothetical protein
MDLWVATTAGLAHLHAGAWVCFAGEGATGENAVLAGDAVFSVARDANGNLWYGSGHGVGMHWVDTARWESRSEADSLVMRSPDNGLWVFENQEAGGTHTGRIAYLVSDLGVSLTAPLANEVLRFDAATSGRYPVTLVWQPNREAEGHEVVLNSVAAGFVNAGSTPPNQLHLNLLPGKYTWTVRGIFPGCIAGRTADARAFEIKVLPQPPLLDTQFDLIKQTDRHL